MIQFAGGGVLIRRWRSSTGGWLLDPNQIWPGRIPCVATIGGSAPGALAPTTSALQAEASLLLSLYLPLFLSPF